MKRMRGKKGFTLMEVLVGIAIVAIISVPLLNMFATSFKVSRYSYDVDKANAAALDIVERFRAGETVLALESGVYTETLYFDYDWKPALAENHVFRAEAVVNGVVSDSMDSAFLPQLGGGHSIIISYLKIVGEYEPTLTLTETENYYTLACGDGILHWDVVGAGVGTITILKTDVNAAVIPVIVDNSANAAGGSVRFQVTGISGVELALYVFGDSEANPVSMSVTGGAASITKLKAKVEALEFDLLKIEVKVIRAKDGVVMADHATTSYVVR